MAGQLRHLVFVLYPQVSLTNLTGAMEVFEQAVLEQERSGGDLSYKFSLVSRDGGPIPSYFGVGVETLPLAALDDTPIHTLFIPGGLGFRDAMTDSKLLSWIKGRANSVDRLCTAGTGSFILAATGLLDRRRVVTHWLMNEEFAERFPQVDLVQNMLYLREKNLWTSAGMGSAIDFSLALLEEDAGREFAFKIAKRVLIVLRRSGDQPQISSVLQAQALEGSRLDRLHEWVHANLKADLSVEALAARVGMSPRNFSRVYVSKMGMTPATAVTKMRLEAAQNAVSHTDARLSTIAYECGFGDEQRMRRAFLRWIGKSPSDLRAEARQDTSAESSAGHVGLNEEDT